MFRLPPPAGQATPQYSATEDGMCGMAASNKLCHNTVPSCNFATGRAI